jgi:hypothetical protein
MKRQGNVTLVLGGTELDAAVDDDVPIQLLREPCERRVTSASSTRPSTPSDEGCPWALRTEGLTKRYGGRLAVDSLDLEVPTGAVAGFIGPNGDRCLGQIEVRLRRRLASSRASSRMLSSSRLS